jgi:putative tryptophan/tyrosine transport system substrate-binding protein
LDRDKKIMKKKITSLTLCAVLLALCSYTEAQQTGKIPRIGVLITASPANATRRVQALQQGLRELGYVEGKNIVIEYRYAEGKPETLPERVDELIRLNVDAIITDTSNAIQAAKNATKTIPVVFTTANDPVGDGQVASLARPGGNLTGLSILAVDLNGKRLELLKEAFPKVTRVAFLTRTGISRTEQRYLAEQRLKEAEVVAKDLGLRLQPLGAKDGDDLESAFGAAKSAGAQALIISPSTFAATHRTGIIELAAKHRMPAIYPSMQFAEAGGLMSYGPDPNHSSRRAAVYVDKILKGAKPADLPVEQPMKFEFAINLKTAKQTGLMIPPNVLTRADKVIR